MKTVKFIGGNIAKGFNKEYGGTPMTIYCYLKAFENDPEYKIEAVDRHYFAGDFYNRFKGFCRSCDILHVDDTTTLLNMYKNNLRPPDVIGPIARSPLKDYKNGGKPEYSADWFYRAKVIRLNIAEERKNADLINLIQHGVDTEMLKPEYLDKTFSIENRKYVLWAGRKHRYAKNYELAEKIKEMTPLPPPYEWLLLSDYKVADYWEILNNTAILINTSLYESFCCAMFEAKSKGVATIYKKGLHGPGVHSDSEIQVEYIPEAYRDNIHKLLSNNTYLVHGLRNRKYVEKHASLKQMRNSIAKIYDIVGR